MSTMHNTDTIAGYYGSNTTECNIFTYDNFDGTSWYCVEGSTNINMCLTSQLVEGVNTDNSEEIQDIDTCYYSQGIHDEADLRLTMRDD